MLRRSDTLRAWLSGDALSVALPPNYIMSPDMRIEWVGYPEATSASLDYALRITAAGQRAVFSNPSNPSGIAASSRNGAWTS